MQPDPNDLDDLVLAAKYNPMLLSAKLGGHPQIFSGGEVKGARDDEDRYLPTLKDRGDRACLMSRGNFCIA